MRKTDKLTLLADLIDDELIEEAIRAGEKSVTVKAQKSRFSRTALIAVCAALALIVCTLPIFYFRHTGLPGDTTEDYGTLPSDEFIIPDAPDGETIDSLDKLNYYGGIMSILQSEGKNFARFAPSTPRLSLLSGGGDRPETIPNVPEDITIQYTFNEHDTFTINNALYFKVNLTTSNFFLAERLGTGEAEVVITSNNIADMITFRKDGRYYSCVLKDKSVSGTGETQYVFSTDNYIDGPYLIKHSSPETVDFCVYISDTGIRMDSRKIHWNNVYAEIGVVNGSYRECNITVTLTVAEISAFFNFKTATNTPALDGDIEHIFCGSNPSGGVEIYLVIYKDGTLLWCNEAFMKDREDSAAYSRSGEISTFNREFIVFHYIDPQGEKVICNTQLTNSGGFEFMGMKFERRSTLAFDRTDGFPVLWFESRGDGAEPLYLYAAENGLFFIGEKNLINPLSRWQDRKPILEGSCRITESTATFAYFADGQHTVQSINYKNGEPFVLGEKEFYLCDSPFSDGEASVRYVTREDSGMKCEIIITNGARYIINDIERGVTIDRGSVRLESDGRSFMLISDPETGNFDELYITPFDDGSIEYRRTRFYPEDNTN